MKIYVAKRHIRLGRPKRNKCPISLACQEQFDLPEYCIDVSPKVLTLLNFKGGILYSIKWPDKVASFYEKFFKHYEFGSSLPKPMVFEFGEYTYYQGYTVDLISEVIGTIKNWNIYYDES